MRAAILPVGTTLLFVSLTAFSSPARAQDDFEDEFDAEGSNQHGQAQHGQTGAQRGTGTPNAADDIDGETPPPAAATPAANATEAAEAWREEHLLTAHNTVEGSTGGIHVVDAGSGPSRTWRVQLATDFFFQNEFLNRRDHDSHIGATLSASWTPFEFLELFLNFAASANHNDTGDPMLFQVLGDTNLGVKAFYNVPSAPWLTVGGDMRLALMNSVGDIGVVLKSTSAGFRGNATADLRRLAHPVPFIARLNLSYFLDNSSALTDQVEQDRYDRLPTTGPSPRATPYANETRNLLTRVERFALGINRLDMFNIALGFEIPVRAMANFYIAPILEWRLGVPVNSRSYNCLWNPAVRGATSGPAAGSDDGCLSNTGPGAFPQTLTFGVRVEPPVRGLSALVAFDIGLTGVNSPVRELAQNNPYDVWLGVSWAYDTRVVPPPAPVIQQVEHRVEVPAQLPVKGRIHGVVVEQGANTPVPDAVIRFPGRELTALHTAADGTFTSYEFDPGEVQIEVDQPEYERGTCTGTIPADRAAAATPVEVRCELVAHPRLGNLHGRVTSDAGLPISTSITLTGPANRVVSSDASGNYLADGLTPGTYTARAEPEGYLVKIQTFEIRQRETTTGDMTLVTRPRRATVTVGRREITIRRQINFATDSDQIDPASNALMAEIADVIQRNPQITKIEIQGHTDNVGQAAHNMDLSQRRADSVRTWLITQGGVDAGRLEAHGYGSTRPQVPNITASNRARNRRTQFLIMEQAGAAAPAAAPAAGGGAAAPSP